MNKLLIITIFSLILSVSAFSQNELNTKYIDVEPPSPTAASLGTYGQVPVGMFTGTAQFNIPLYQLKSRKLSLPISLNYSTNGVKVDEIASWVGMGWSLSAGGVITRIVRDRADEKSTRVSFDNVKRLSDLDFHTRNEIMLDPDNEDMDSEPDLYSYNFNGQSGKFIIDTDGFPRMIPHQDVTMEVLDGSGYERTFIITTKDGVKYYFGERQLGDTTQNSTIEATTSNSKCEGDTGQSTTNYTAYYLTRIVHPAGDEIKLKYTKGSAHYDSGIQQTYSNGVYDSTCSECGGVTSNITCTTEVFQSISLLSEISTDNIVISFDSSKRTLGAAITNNRNYQLDEITIKDKNDLSVEHRFDFDYQYSNSTSHTHTYDGSGNRLFLDGIVETGTDITNPKEHTFEYNSMNSLPVRLSFAQDQYGYFNGANNGENFVDIGNYSGLFSGFTSANREPNFNYAKYGSLSKITYPTGGTSEIDYEAHEYSLSGQDYETGGIRVKRITSRESLLATPKIERYYYSNLLLGLTTSSGNSPWTPKYFSSTYFDGDTGSGFAVCTTNHLSSNSNTQLFNIGGSHIAYHYVVKSYGENFENGGEQFEYVAERDDTGFVVNSYLISGGDRIIPGSGMTNLGWNSGTLLKHQTFKKNGSGGYTILKKEENTYNFQSGYGEPGSNLVNSDTISAGVINKVYTTGYERGLVSMQIFPTYICYDSDKTKKTWTGWKCDNTHKHLWASDPSSDGWKCFSQLDGGPVNVKTYDWNPCSEYTYTGSKTITLAGIIECYNVSVYDIIVRWQYLKEKKITQYDDAGLNPIVTTINYEYDNVLHSQQTKTTTTNSKGESIVQEFYYPLDYNYNSQTNLKPLVENSMHGLQVDVRSENDGKLTSGQLLKYNDDGQVTEVHQADTELSTTLAFSNTNPYSYGQRKLSINYNSTTGNIDDFNKEDGPTTAYLWGYNDEYPVAKVENATYSEVIATPSINLSTINSPSTTDSVMRTQIDLIRQHLPNAMVTTYTYDPLKGVTSVTDSKGQTTYYEYDNLSRLEYIKDSQGKILSKTEYNYKN